MKTERQNMNMKPLILIPMLFIGLGVLPKAQALSPAPDGGYPGRNTAEGQKALFSLTTGTDNAALGHSSLQSLTTGKLNTGVGAWTLALNTADYNTACGAAALLFNGTGTDNTAVGTGALLFNTIGEGNTATGTFALYNNTEGDFNTANGEFTLYFNTTGERNTAIGDSALYLNTEGSRNTAIGNPALLNNTTGNDNTAIGASALEHNTTGFRNTVLGADAGTFISTANNVICIGTHGNNQSNSCYIGNIFGETSSGGTAVFINSDGKLGTTTSSRRFKDEIKPMDKASEALYALKPVTFRYKQGIDPRGLPQFGLVAEDVEEVNPELVVRDKEGKVNTVRYEAVNAMLLNEFLKEHRKVQEQEASIADLRSTIAEQRKDFETITAQEQKQLEASTAGLKEQAAQIQKVNAQIEISKPMPQTVVNHR
jgi:hypothetical protein